MHSVIQYTDFFPLFLLAAYCRKEESRVPGTCYVESGFLQPRTRGVNAHSIYYNHLKRTGSSDGSLLSNTKVADIVARKKVTPRGPTYEGERFCYVVTGATGLGKSFMVRRIARIIANRLQWKVYYKNDTQWWQRYSSEEIVIFNEFDGGYPFTEFKLLVDNDPFMCNCKGDSYESNIRLVFICSNVPTSQWYYKYSHRDAALRRVRKCWLLQLQDQQIDLGKEIIKSVFDDMFNASQYNDPTSTNLDPHYEEELDKIITSYKPIDQTNFCSGWSSVHLRDRPAQSSEQSEASMLSPPSRTCSLTGSANMPSPPASSCNGTTPAVISPIPPSISNDNPTTQTSDDDDGDLIYWSLQLPLPLPRT